MADPKSGYKLEQNSPAGRPGLESFKSQEDELYYFHVNDEKGRPVLFSQGYATARQRTAHRNTVRKRLHLPEAYKKSSAANAYFFTLLSASGNELARSRDFDHQTERDAALQALTEPPESKTAAPKPPPQKQAKPAPPKTGSDAEADSHKSVLSSRFRYNLIFRRMEEAQPLVGEIEYPVLKKRATFQGLDHRAIIAFIIQFLPEDIRAESHPYKNEAELARELKQAQARERSLNKALSEAKKNAKASATDYKERIAEEQAKAKAAEAALLEKAQSAQRQAEERAEQLSAARAAEQAARRREQDLNEKVQALLQNEKELQQQLSSALAKLNRESEAAAELKKQLAALQAEHPAEGNPEPSAGPPPAQHPPARPTPPAPKKVRKGILLMAGKRRAGRTVDLQKTRYMALHMPLRTGTEQKALESFKADIIIKSLRNNRLVNIIRNYYGTLSADRKNVAVPIPKSNFTPGSYSLTMVVTSVQPPYDRSSPKFEGELVIEVV